MKKFKIIFLLSVTLVLLAGSRYFKGGTEIYIRVNQAGYLSGETKSGIAFSNNPVPKNFQVVDAGTDAIVFTGKSVASPLKGWAPYNYFSMLDFSDLQKPGEYRISFNQGSSVSEKFRIGDDAYRGYADDLLIFMRQQRCGYNPFFDQVCHQQDGRMMYGPLPDSTYVDVSGGWHDAGDQLKYLITGSFATAFMMKAYELTPSVFDDRVNALGQPGSNGIPDVLDESKWGLDWIQKMHPHPDWLFHQVGDDRDHLGWKYPFRETSDYGWGKGSYRIAYFATGKPQGLKKFKSEATGIANLAGRSSAAMAIGSRIWNHSLHDTLFASQCLKSAIELYRMGKKQEGYQQGNSYGEPYRYNEDTWADDMEWAAAELYSASDDKNYLNDAIHYADLIGPAGWMEFDSVAHYRYYPFINMGHYALYPFVDREVQARLAGYYRSGIENCLARGHRNVYGEGAPFIWCSNNLVVALATQIILYEQMTGDLQYHKFLLAQRDWLLGKNPWGTSMFMNIPQYGEYPREVHTSTWALTKKEVPGGLVDGPVYASIYSHLLGIHLTHEDPFALFQNNYVVYHDDNGDYSTNEPTMDGTASAILMMGWFDKMNK